MFHCFTALYYITDIPAVELLQVMGYDRQTDGQMDRQTGRLTYVDRRWMDG